MALLHTSTSSALVARLMLAAIGLSSLVEILALQEAPVHSAIVTASGIAVEELRVHRLMRKQDRSNEAMQHDAAKAFGGDDPAPAPTPSPAGGNSTDNATDNATDNTVITAPTPAPAPGDGSGSGDDSGSGKDSGNSTDNSTGDGGNSSDNGTTAAPAPTPPPTPAPPTPAPPPTPEPPTPAPPPLEAAPLWRRRPLNVKPDLPSPDFPLLGVPPDPNAGKKLQGKCPEFKEGSSVREKGEGYSRFLTNATTGSQPTQDQCFAFCFSDGACEQASYWATERECYLGISIMNTAPSNTACSDGVDCCYAKSGYGTGVLKDVKDGMCSNFPFTEAGDQCDITWTAALDETGAEVYQNCRKWGAEWGLSEVGCWVKCQEHERATGEKCTQANYQNESMICEVGPNAMTALPSQASCAIYQTCRCWAPDGFAT